MKIRFIKNVSADVMKIRLGEYWPKYFYRNDELLVDSISYSKQSATIQTTEGDVIEDISIDSFESVNEIKQNLLKALL